jgi:hypothetical protein
MPVKKINPGAERHPDLVGELARVLREDKSEGPPDEPEVVIEQLKHSDNLHVTVIWDKWVGIDPEERGGASLDAFAQAKGETEMLRITFALGVTRSEAQKLQVRTTVES